MSKDAVADWDVTAANNTDVGGINTGEGMAPGDVNDALREMMAQIAAEDQGSEWHGTATPAPSDSLTAITKSGVYAYLATDTDSPSSQAGVVLHMQRSAGRAVQIASPSTTISILQLFWRELSGAGWSDWYEIMHGDVGSNAKFNMSTTGVTISATETSGVDIDAAEYGFFANFDGGIIVSRSGNIPARFKRSNDGVLVGWYIGTTNVGNVSSASGVVTYGSFCGAHWSQFRSHARPNVLRGTILETIDRLCSWPDESETVLPQVVIAAPGSRSVYGVFSHWDEDTRDIHVASLGTNSVRIAPGVVVKRGDLIEAGLDGCGVVQADDVFRAGTVAKVTAAVCTETYPDGSYLVPCTLHCG